jgi:hypothetical protein
MDDEDYETFYDNCICKKGIFKKKSMATSLSESFQPLATITNCTKDKSLLYHLNCNSSNTINAKKKTKKKADKQLSKREVDRLHYKEHRNDIKKKKVHVLSRFQINDQIKLYLYHRISVKLFSNRFYFIFI